MSVDGRAGRLVWAPGDCDALPTAKGINYAARYSAYPPITLQDQLADPDGIFLKAFQS